MRRHGLRCGARLRQSRQLFPARRSQAGIDQGLEVLIRPGRKPQHITASITPEDIVVAR